MSTASLAQIRLPNVLLPSDGRFGCGPSKIRPDAITALAGVASTWMGTSHRQTPVRNVVGSVRSGLRDLFSLPDGWEVVIGNGGSTVFWDVATFGLITSSSHHLVFGEFSTKFAQASGAAPHLDEPTITSSVPGSHPDLPTEVTGDILALTHNETSTGVSMTPRRPAGNGLVVVDATSAAGGLTWSPSDVDVYYFAPQKCFASDGGLWLALCSPAAIDRIESIAATGRWCPASLDLKIALDNSRLNQTYNTPALATIFLLDQQIQWMNQQGGLGWTSRRCTASSGIIYDWAEARSWANPFVADPLQRSAVVATIDLADVDANDVNAILRTNGIVDTESYRKLGRNQLRIGTFPSVDPDDVQALVACIDYVAEALTP